MTSFCHRKGSSFSRSAYRGWAIFGHTTIQLCAGCRAKQLPKPCQQVPIVCLLKPIFQPQYTEQDHILIVVSKTYYARKLNVCQMELYSTSEKERPSPHHNNNGGKNQRMASVFFRKLQFLVFATTMSYIVLHN